MRPKNKGKYHIKVRPAYFLHCRITQLDRAEQMLQIKKELIQIKPQLSCVLCDSNKLNSMEYELSINQYDSTCSFDGCQEECRRAPVFCNFSTFPTIFVSLSTRFSPSFCFHLVNHLSMPYLLIGLHFKCCTCSQTFKFSDVQMFKCSISHRCHL